MKRWILLFCLSAALCATLAAADMVPTPLNCHEMAALWFANQDEARLLGADGAEAALSDYFEAREAAFRGDVRLLSADESMSAEVAANNALRTERVKEMEARLGLTVLDADVTTWVDRDSATRNPDGTLTLCVYEWTFYDYDDLSDGAGGLDVSGFGGWRFLTLAERSDGSYEILSDECDESDLFGINTLSPERQKELLDSVPVERDAPYTEEPADASLLAISYYPDYNVEAAVAYSEKYWGGLSSKTYKEGDKETSDDAYNPAYANYNSIGGDCANFTSQCIAAGGMPQVVTKAFANNGWYYKSENDRSGAWTLATQLHHWMRDNRGHCVTASKSAVFAGSPVFYSKAKYSSDATRASKQENISFSHAVLCVGTNSAGTPVINSHNTNRWHAIWNYYTGATEIDTVQLTSKSFGSFSGYVKLDADFYANIINPALNRYVTNDGAGKVSSRAKTDSAAQVWHFTRQDDGSYQILSVLRDGTRKQPALAAAEGGWASRTPVCTEEYAAGPGQQWYLYQSDSVYHLRPKCSDRVLDIFEASDAEGADMWIFSKQSAAEDLKAQLFQIYPMDWVELDEPVLEMKLEGGEGANVSFTWEAVSGAASYNLRVTQGETLIREVTLGKTSSYAMRLEPGEYQAALEAFSANKRTSNISDVKSFTVYTSYVITFNANGGTDAPVEQMKIEQVDANITEETPVYPGYAFVSWNTQANGTGATYMSGAVYDKDENLTLYAQWTPDQFTVTLEPNGGALLDTERTVTYTEPYGELPTPVRDGKFEFAGWYTELAGGDLITEESRVRTPDNHTLYAHWDSTEMYLLPDVRKSGSRYRVVTTLYRVPEGVLFVCGYLDGQLADVVSENIGENQTTLTVDMEGEFDKILVMAFDSAENMRPSCKSESVTKF